MNFPTWPPRLDLPNSGSLQWSRRLLHVLLLDKNFVPFLDATWQKETAANPRRGITNDGFDVPEAQRLTLTQKNAHLELLLGQIANFCPVISRNSIVKHSTSLNHIWQKIRQHYGFQSIGAHFLDLASIHLQPDERPKDLFQRLMAFFEDNLLSVHGGWTHHGVHVSRSRPLPNTREHFRRPLASVDTSRLTSLSETKNTVLNYAIRRSLHLNLRSLKLLDLSSMTYVALKIPKQCVLAVPHQGATVIVAKAILNVAPSCPASSAKPPVANITITTWWIVVTYLTVTVDHGLSHAWW